MSFNHIPGNSSDVAPCVLLPGDSARVDQTGVFLEGFTLVGQRREFRLGKGTYAGVDISVCSTGIGCSSTAIAVEELIAAGAKTLIRVGTCGGAWQSDIACGSIVIPSACVRDEGTTVEYIPLGFPAMADPQVVSTLRWAASRQRINAVVGINRTHDAYYGSLDAITRWGRYLSDQQWKTHDTPIVSSEMECAALFVVATLRGVRSGAVLAVTADPEPLRDRIVGRKQEVIQQGENKAARQAEDSAITVALQAAAALSRS